MDLREIQKKQAAPLLLPMLERDLVCTLAAGVLSMTAHASSIRKTWLVESAWYETSILQFHKAQLTRRSRKDMAQRGIHLTKGDLPEA